MVEKKSELKDSSDIIMFFCINFVSFQKDVFVPKRPPYAITRTGAVSVAPGTRANSATRRAQRVPLARTAHARVAAKTARRVTSRPGGVIAQQDGKGCIATMPAMSGIMAMDA